jgi:hypothetical protein
MRRARGAASRLVSEKVEAIVSATLHTTPRDATHWSVRTLAHSQRVSPATVHRIWQAAHLQPHRTETFKLSRDPHFVRKLRDVVGLYMNPPAKALVLSVDEKSRDPGPRSHAADLALAAGRAGPADARLHAQWDDDPVCGAQRAGRHVIEACQPRHTHAEFLALLDKIDRQIPASGTFI